MGGFTEGRTKAMDAPGETSLNRDQILQVLLS